VCICIYIRVSRIQQIEYFSFDIYISDIIVVAVLTHTAYPLAPQNETLRGVKDLLFWIRCATLVTFSLSLSTIEK
jgi:hypothetical protein